MNIKQSLSCKLKIEKLSLFEKTRGSGLVVDAGLGVEIVPSGTMKTDRTSDFNAIFVHILTF